MKKRTGYRIDYKELHSSGEKVYVNPDPATIPSILEEQEKPLVEILQLLERFSFHDSNNEGMSNEENECKNLAVEEATLADDIIDFLEENAPDSFGESVEDVNSAIKRAEDLRSIYRKAHKELSIQLGERYEERYGKAFASLIGSIKDYIMKTKSYRRGIKEQQVSVNQSELQNDIMVQKRKNQFIINEIGRILSDLEKTLTVDLDECSDGEIKSRKSDFTELNKDIQTLSTYMKDVMESSTMNTTTELNKLNSRYNLLLKNKVQYVENLHREIKSREIEKKDVFNSSKLNIKLPKYKGYNSIIDIYSFQTQFEKLYLKTTPTLFLPDLLKNNHLEDPALLIVKNVDNMDEIWRRLKDAYGDHKMLLTKKISELQNFDAIWRTKDPEKSIESVGRIINLMKDLMELAKKHKIEEKLYHSNALDTVYNLLGDYRMTRWLNIICDDSLEGRELWQRLIVFLEKEIKVIQQKLLIQGKSPKSHTLQAAKLGRLPQSHYASDDTSCNGKQPSDITKVPPCFICGASDHVQTRGPGGMKLVQYFACKKFVSMTPHQRLVELKSKGLCFQCLFPGAECSKGKHRDGHCQRDFSCKHPSHEQYQSKKHVLVCNEHKDTQQNRDLLEHFKSRCISKLPQLQSFSKDIQVSFHVPSTTCFRSSSKEHNDKAIFMLQTIKINHQKYTIFYDSGCGDFISRFQSIGRIESRAMKVQSGPITLGGVGGTTTQCQHGIYSVKLPLKNGNEAFFTGICMDQITATFPLYPLQGKVEDDIKANFQERIGDPSELPRLPRYTGGDVDFMIGIKYMRYFPEPVYQLPSGLTIYRSHFFNEDGYSDGVIGGPHQIFNDIDKHHQFNHSLTHFVQDQHQLFQMGYQVNPDISLLGFHHERDFDTQQKYDHLNSISNPSIESISTVSSPDNTFHQVEYAGSEIKFRCAKCRSCNTCKKHEKEETLH